MPRKKPAVPPFRIHKASRQGYVTVHGRRTYLGRADDPETQQKYSRLIAEWAAGQGQPLAKPTDLALVEPVSRFRKHAETYHRKPDGRPMSTLSNYASAFRHLNKLYSDVAVSQFNRRSLKAVRQSMIEAGGTRGSVNKSVHPIRSVFRWGVAEGIVPQSVSAELQSIVGLRRGRCEVREGEDRRKREHPTGEGPQHRPHRRDRGAHHGPLTRDRTQGVP